MNFNLIFLINYRTIYSRRGMFTVNALTDNFLPRTEDFILRNGYPLHLVFILFQAQ